MDISFELEKLIINLLYKELFFFLEVYCILSRFDV